MSTPLKCPITNTQCHEGCKCDDADEFTCMLDEDGNRRWPYYWERALDMSEGEVTRAIQHRPGARMSIQKVLADAYKKDNKAEIIPLTTATGRRFESINLSSDLNKFIKENPLLAPLKQCIFALESVVYLNATINQEAKDELWKYAQNAKQAIAAAGYDDGSIPRAAGGGATSPDAGVSEQSDRPDV